MDGRNDFDFLFGRWRISNRKRVNPLVEGDAEWIEFDAESDARPIVGGTGNIDTYSAPDFPGRPGFEGFTLRLFEPATGLWRIWWASSIGDGRLDEPVLGRFDGDVGIFECEDVIDGISVRVRYTWTVETVDSLRWEQAFSFDEGATWDTNWVMESTRIASHVPRVEGMMAAQPDGLRAKVGAMHLPLGDFLQAFFDASLVLEWFEEHPDGEYPARVALRARLVSDTLKVSDTSSRLHT